VSDPSTRLASGDAEYVEGECRNSVSIKLEFVSFQRFTPTDELMESAMSSVTQTSSPMEVDHSPAAQLERDVHTQGQSVSTVSSRFSKDPTETNEFVIAVESITNNRFRSRRCATFDDATEGRCTEAGPLMGGEPSNYANQVRGIFHLTTNANSPFGQG
jgi:hypothetical protein